MDFDFALREGEDLPGVVLRQLRGAGPVVWSDAMQGWLVNSYDAVREVLSDVSRFTSAGTPVAEAFGGEAMLVNDTAMHHRIRAVWAKRVGVAAMAERHAEFVGFAREVLEPARKLLASGESIDLVPVFRDYVLKVIASTFDVPLDRTDVFIRWSENSADTPAMEMAEGSDEQQRHFAVRQDVFDLIAEQVADRKVRMARVEEPADLIALMVAAEGSDGITPSIGADNIFNFMLGALDTSEKWFGNITCRLYRDPQLLAQVCADPALIGRLIDEVMRFDTVAQTIQRRVKDDGVELCGQAMKQGDAVLVMLGAANRDAEAFADPDNFDIDRVVQSNLGFGFGFHHCLGLNIARTEAIALVEAMIDSLPALQIENADFGESWALWGPRALTVSLPAAA
ncbi:MAG: cytochrome P450 [Novosphingobium sp.]|nr:cytochrome P450 [Novosphingobium sp.]